MNQSRWIIPLLPLFVVSFGSPVIFAGGDWIALSKDAWRGYQRQRFPDKGWAVEPGTFRTVPGGGPADLITKRRFRNFELELQWKVSSGGNGGIFYRVAETDPEIWHTGPEIQVLDDDRHNDGKNPKTSAGSLYALVAPSGKELRPVGEFNQFRLIVRGNHVEHWLNGNKIVEYELGSDSLKALIAHSKFSDKPHFGKAVEGHIGLQHHGEEVWYRNIRIRELP